VDPLLPCGSSATLTMLWWNSWSLTGEVHEKLTILLGRLESTWKARGCALQNPCNQKPLSGEKEYFNIFLWTFVPMSICVRWSIAFIFIYWTRYLFSDWLKLYGRNVVTADYTIIVSQHSRSQVIMSFDRGVNPVLDYSGYYKSWSNNWLLVYTQSVILVF